MTPNHHPDAVADCDAIQALIPDYAFGLTDSVETQLVEANLARCSGAAEQLIEFQHIQDMLREDVQQYEPSAQLGERLMAAVAGSPIDKSVSQPVPMVSSRGATPVSSRSHRPVLWLISAAAVIALVASNIFWYARVDELTRQKNDLTTQLAAANIDASADPNTFVLNTTNELRWVRLPGSEGNTNANAFMMWNGDSNVGLLYVSGFPALEAGKVYQLWLTRNGERSGVGTFTVDADGKSALLFHIYEPIDNFAWMWITIEPEAGSDTPSEEVIVSGELVA